MSLEAFSQPVSSLGSSNVLADHHNGLLTLRHFPQPIYLLDRALNLIATNEQGQRAIKKHWVGLRMDSLHFYCSSNDLSVRNAIHRLFNSAVASERVILRCVDNVYRSYTLSLAPSEDDLLLMTIQDDFIQNEQRIDALSKAFSLSSSEAKILRLMVEGLKPKEIGYEVGISLSTVRSHLRTLYAKMNVRNYNDALTQAIRLLV